MKKMHKNRQKFFCLAGTGLFLIILILQLLFVLIPDQKYSEAENRNLKTMPSVHAEQVLSGRYASNMETYVSDQFPFRTLWIQFKVFSDRILGKRESNSIFLAKKGYLIEKFTNADEKNYTDMLEALKEFRKKEKALKQYMMVVPTAVNIYADALPAFAPTDDQNAFLDQLKADVSDLGIAFTDVREAFQKAEDVQLYYKTDHHWTTDGAWLGYQQFAGTAGFDSSKIGYERLPISDTFCGTMSASSGFRMEEKENIYVYLPKNSKLQYTVTYVEEGKQSASFYQTDALEKRDQYSIFLGGNHPLIKISTTAGTGKVLLLIKDSYANCMIPFLAEHYDKILVVDPRYYYEDLYQLITSEKITEVLYLYNANGFAADTSLKTVLQTDS